MVDKDVLKKLYIFKAPLVLAPPKEGWEVPRPLREKVIPSRIECVASGEFDEELSSIADMVIHLWNASLKYPLPGEYVRIYAYYTDKLLDGVLKKNTKILPIPDKLTDYEESIAMNLRRQIFRRQMKEIEKIIRESNEDMKKLISATKSVIDNYSDPRGDE